MKQAEDLKEKLISESLQELAKDVDAKMKAEAELKFDMGRSTINDYLKGKIGNAYMAGELFKFFRKKVIALTPLDQRA